MINLRQNERVKSRSILRYWTVDRSMMISHAYDISKNGISFNTGKEYQTGTPIYVQLRTPAKENEVVTFRTQVSNQTKNNENDLYRTGTKIMKFHDGDSNILDNYINFMKSNIQ